MGLTTGLVAYGESIGPGAARCRSPWRGAGPGTSTCGTRGRRGAAHLRGCDVLMNATGPRFVMPLFPAVLSVGVHYPDTPMSLNFFEISRLRHSARPARTSLVTVFQR